MATNQTTVGQITGLGSIDVNGIEFDTVGASYEVDDAVARNVECVSPFRLAEMAARTLLAQHRVGNGVSERLEIRLITGALNIVENVARLAHDTVARVHQVARDTRYAIGMTAATGTFRCREVARERNRSLVRPVFGR